MLYSNDDFRTEVRMRGKHQQVGQSVFDRPVTTLVNIKELKYIFLGSFFLISIFFQLFFQEIVLCFVFIEFCVIVFFFNFQILNDCDLYLLHMPKVYFLFSIYQTSYFANMKGLCFQLLRRRLAEFKRLLKHVNQIKHNSRSVFLFFILKTKWL